MTKLDRIEVDGMMVDPCVKCGYCCTVRACGYGEWDGKRKCCVHLTEPNEFDQRLCGIYEKIYPIEKSFKYGFFDCGCSSSLFNDIRNNVVNKIRSNYEQAKKQ